MFQAEETVCAKALGLERKAKVQSRREWSENDPGDVVSPPTQSEGKLGRLFGSVYNWGCNTVPHVVLFTTLDCYLPILLTISSFLPSPSYDTLSLSLQDSSICHKLGIPISGKHGPHQSAGQPNKSVISVCAFMDHLEMEHC